MPLTSEINASGYGYKMNRNSVLNSNLASSDDQQQGEFQILKQFSEDIKMTLAWINVQKHHSNRVNLSALAILSWIKKQLKAN